MNNPFKDQGAMLPIASLNRLFIGEKQLNQLFQANLLINQIMKEKKTFEITDAFSAEDAIKILDSALNHDSKKRLEAEMVLEPFANHLCSMIQTLKRPSQKDKDMRKDWNESHWAYWSIIKTFHFIGGMLLPNIAAYFQRRVADYVALHDLNLIALFYSNSNNFALCGLSKHIKQDSLIFDFGQTGIKRSLFQGEHLTVYEPLPARHLVNRKEYTKLDNARILHNYLIDTIFQTIQESGYMKKNIHIAISNYVKQNRLSPSLNGYGMLQIFEDYQAKCVFDLRVKTNKDYNLNFYHDVTAASYEFDIDPTGVVISLGTAIGLCFLDR